MGNNLVTGVTDLNPLSVARSVSHDFFVYVANACESDCNCCSCWRFGFKTTATSDVSDDEPSSVSIAWH